MKAFDLEAAKRGAAVCTECGAPVEIITFNARSFTYPILGYAGRTGRIRKFMKDGKSADSPFNDLMMRDDDYREKLERGEYDHIADARKMVGPTIKQNLNTNREYWRRVYAGQIVGGLASNNGLNIIGSEIIVAKASCGIADALIEELEKTEKK